MFGKNSKPQSRIDSLIGVGTRVEGNIYFTGGLRVDGEVNGSIIAEPDKNSTLVISEHAKVCGEVRVTHLVLNGTVIGPIEASEYLELQGKARVTGDVTYKTLEIQLGAIVDGKLAHISETSGKGGVPKTGSSES